MAVRKRLLGWSRMEDLMVAGRVRALGSLAHFVPSARPSPSLMAMSYEVMQERLRTSLREIARKERQLEESEEEVRRSRDFLQAVIDSLDDDMMVLDEWYHVTQANRSLQLKHQREQVLGRCCYEVTHGAKGPCQPPLCKCPISQVWRTGIPARVIHVHRGADGRETYVEVSASPVCDTDGRVLHVVEMMRDVTEGKMQEKQLADVNRRLLALNAIAATVSQSLSLDFVLHSALDQALEQVGARLGAILLFDVKAHTLSCPAHRGFSDRFVERAASRGLSAPVIGAAAGGQTVVVDDVERDLRAEKRGALSEEGLRALLAVPLKSKERTVGVLVVGSREPRPFPPEEVQLIVALGHQLGVSIENAQLYAELQSRERLRAETLRKVITAQEDERRRVARELHDVTSQALATLVVRLQAVTTVPPSDLGELEVRLAELRPLLDDTSREVHRLIYDLRPSLLDDLGLAAAIRSCAHNALDAAGIEVHVEVVGEERRLPSTVEIATFRIVQEAITNIARHAHAESTYVSIEFGRRRLRVQVEDDGRGFEPSALPQEVGDGAGIGLLGMQERADLLGGRLELQSRPGEGTRVLLELPLEEVAADD